MHPLAYVAIATSIVFILRKMYLHTPMGIPVLVLKKVKRDRILGTIGSGSDERDIEFDLGEYTFKMDGGGFHYWQYIHKESGEEVDGSTEYSFCYRALKKYTVAEGEDRTQIQKQLEWDEFCKRSIKSLR